MNGVGDAVIPELTPNERQDVEQLSTENPGGMHSSEDVARKDDGGVGGSLFVNVLEDLEGSADYEEVAHMARIRLLQHLVPPHFALRTLCPGIYAYAKATGWPSSRAQLLRDRQLVDVSMRSFYASLRPSRLRNQTAAKVETPLCSAFIYNSSCPRRSREGIPSFFVKVKNAACSRSNAPSDGVAGSASLPRISATGTLPGDCMRARTSREPAPPSDSSRAPPTPAEAGTSLAQALAASPVTPRPVAEPVSGGDEERVKRAEEAVGRQEADAGARLAATGPEAPSPSQLPAAEQGGWVEAAVRIAELIQSTSGVSDAPREGRKSVLQRLRDMSPRRSKVADTPDDKKRDETRQKWIFFLHGGAFVFNRPDSYRLFTNDISVLTGAKVFCPDYTLAPERVWPAQLEECLAAYEFLCAEVGVRGEDIILMGDSAGGNLAVTLMAKIIERDRQGEADEGGPARLPRPAGMVLLSPWLDLTMKGPSYTLNAAREPVLPLASIRQSIRVYVHGRFDLGQLSEAEIEAALDATTSEKLCLDSPVAPRSEEDGDSSEDPASSPSLREVPGDQRNFSNPWISPVFFGADVLKEMPQTLIHVGSLEVLLSDSLIFGRRVNEAVSGCKLPPQAWSSADEALFAAEVNPRKGRLVASLPRSGQPKGVTEETPKSWAQLGKAREGVDASAQSLEALAPREADEPEPAPEETEAETAKEAPAYFKSCGWLSEADVQKLNSEGTLCPVGCEARAARVEVKVWKDEFHVVSPSRSQHALANLEGVPKRFRSGALA
ncbi:alpha/beta hydrolase fold domain-containing protein [Besnoitia besnoiti]|uniref:Alpha/beta hydrolase fold domain-containing protein n=1 Tax=Besnoitia besnoiti TaxID=94643 RepID=A0A2A9MJB9_BESBE|nr:alpha/beta hydrolase fold domain-containing protein [Besnoitia besnoiti]PFH38009.1 alpha/beta hydrolase fold domain-containing protein [Besnoitia besnoiti]